MRWTRSTIKTVHGTLVAVVMVYCVSTLVAPNPKEEQPQASPGPMIDGRVVRGGVVAKESSDVAVVAGPTHNGKEVTVDLPASQHIKNFGAPNDDRGLCVFCSLTMCSRWHHISELINLTYWDKAGKPHSKVLDGGGWPGKVEKVVKEFAPDWADRLVQKETNDPAAMDKAMSEGMAVCVTYGYGERYNMQTIYHMVVLAYLDSEDACILDNNFPGTFEWMSRKEFLKRWIHPSGKGWYLFFLAPPPPPTPSN